MRVQARPQQGQGGACHIEQANQGLALLRPATRQPRHAPSGAQGASAGNGLHDPGIFMVHKRAQPEHRRRSGLGHGQVDEHHPTAQHLRAQGRQCKQSGQQSQGGEQKPNVHRALSG